MKKILKKITVIPMLIMIVLSATTMVVSAEDEFDPWIYDEATTGTPGGNENNTIEEFEYMNAVQDYYNGTITYEQVSQVHDLYNSQEMKWDPTNYDDPRVGDPVGNNNGIIDEFELMNAIQDYYNGVIVLSQVWEVMALYPYNVSIWNPWIYDDPDVGTPPGNDNDVIDYHEFINAEQDYFDGIITLSQLQEVQNLYQNSSSTWSVDVSPSSILIGRTTQVELSLSGYPYQNVYVGLNGCGIDTSGSTDSNGKVVFSLTPTTTGSILIDVGSEGNTVDESITVSVGNLTPSPPVPIISFVFDSDDYTITVASVFLDDLSWSDVKIECVGEIGGTSGLTKSGIISAGDKIDLKYTGLSGTVDVFLYWIPTGGLLYSHQFESDLGTLKIHVSGSNQDGTETYILENAKITFSDIHGNVIRTNCMTNNLGEYGIYLREGSYVVSVSKDGYNPASSLNVQVTASEVTDYYFTLIETETSEGWITGQVFGSSDNETSTSVVLKNAKVSAVDNNGKLITYTYTDDNGRYLIYIKSGVYQVTAAKTGYISQTQSKVVVVTSQGTYVTFNLQTVEEESKGYVSGTVYASVSTENGSFFYKLKDVAILISTIGNNTVNDEHIVAKTDSQGYFRFKYDSGKYNLKAYKSGYYTVYKQISIIENDEIKVDFFLKKMNSSEICCSIYGRVFEKLIGGVKPLGNVSVALSKKIPKPIQAGEPQPITSQYGETIENGKIVYINGQQKVTKIIKPVETWKIEITDENGEYWFEGLSPGTYELRVSKKGYETETKTITLGKTNVEANFYLESAQIPIPGVGVLVLINNTIASFREIGGSVQYIDQAILSGNVGGELVIDGELNSDIIEYNDLMTIKPLTIVNGELSLIVSGDHGIAGKTIVISAAEGIFDENGELLIEYDGEKIQLADDLEDVLNPNDDGSHPEYLILKGAKGMQIMISIPHFSDHFISISSVAEIVDALGGINALLFYVAFISLIAVACVAPIYLLNKKK